jgi:hypothetical protein
MIPAEYADRFRRRSICVRFTLPKRRFLFYDIPQGAANGPNGPKKPSAK